MANRREIDEMSIPRPSVDLLLRTKHSLYIVEIKHRRRIDASVIDEVREKVVRLRPGSGISVRTVLVCEGELDPKLEAEGYFDFVIPFCAAA
jgi:hypothetical protein